MHSLTKNGQKDAEYTVAVEAEKSRDSIRFSFTAARDGVEVFSNEQELPLTSLAEDGSNAYVFHSSWYDKATNGVAFITFYTDVDFQVFAASYKDRSYIGSTDAHFDVESVKEALDYKENVFLEDVFGEG